MLASRLEKAFPQIRLIQNTSLFDLEDFDPDGFDLVVSTIPLPIPSGSYVQVHPLLSEDEVESIRDHLREKMIRDPLREKSFDARLAERASSESLEVFGGGQTKFDQMAEATQVIAELLEDAFLARHEARGSVPEAVRLMCESLAGRGLISNPNAWRLICSRAWSLAESGYRVPRWPCSTPAATPSSGLPSRYTTSTSLWNWKVWTVR